MTSSKHTRNRLFAGMVTFAAAAALAACGNKSSQSSGDKSVINWATPTEINTLDISKNTDTYSAMAIGNSGSNLLRQGKNGKLLPDLAKKVEVSKDGKTYTATLRSGLKWSDGSAITAEDFVYSWQRIVDPKTASEYAYLASDAHVLNAEDVIAGKKPVSALGVKADGNKVVFTLSNPSPQFMSLLSFSNFCPQDKAFVAKAGKNYGTNSDNALYSGPYVVKNWNGTSGKFKLVKNKYYWDAKNVKTKTVNIQTVKKPDTAVEMFKKGQLDAAGISSTSAIYAANKHNKAVVDVPEATTAYMVYNETGTVKSLTNQKIRQALNLATDRKGLVKAAIDTGSKPATALVPTGLQTLPNGTDLAKFVSPGYTYNKAKAAKLFKQGLKELGSSKLSLTVTSDADSPVAKASVDFLKQTWEDALPGLKVEEKFVTFKQRLEDTKNQNFEVALVLWGGDYPEGSTFYGLFPTGSAYNYGKFTNKAYDAAYKKAINQDALKPEAAAKDYKAAEKALFDQADYNPLYFRVTQALQNQSLKNLVRNPTGLSVDFTHAYKK